MSQTPLSARKVIVVNENDQVMGEARLLDAHRGEGILHRAASVFLFRRNAGRIELLIQQRSREKIVGAGQWANTVCGNVSPGESYEQCAHRRLKQELGIDSVGLTHLRMYRYQVRCNEQFSENEMDALFAGWYDGPITPNSEEVARFEWAEWPIKSLDADKKLAPWFALFLNDPKVRVSLNAFLENSL